MKKQTENKGKLTSKPLTQNEDIEEEISELEQPSDEIETRREDEPLKKFRKLLKFKLSLRKTMFQTSHPHFW